MLISIALWAVITLHGTILMPFLSYFASLHEEGECRQMEFWPEKGASLRYLFCATPKAVETTCQILLLLVGFDTLTYRKDYDRSPTLVGNQDSFLAPLPGSEAPLVTGIW